MLMTFTSLEKSNFVTLMPEIILYTIVSLRLPCLIVVFKFPYLKIGEASINTILTILKINL